ncbi:hypothetical protein DC522_17310 [Microvirga sp. KLBC 81]|uniref:DUF2232 domain-containing protein n=1 Tax=Microvirga sp. KLBC 81 TaxID=1862707 RepID=UPI000D514894|nr:DUF2232 domain-containing protein [Microvirga sp. KLBC 81]PVE23116.1 hypothetical protein DC522_17310 [Microvirga sp. KLBC 81]
MNFIATGIGAGLVSALLTVVVVKATPLAAVLYMLAPVPVLIVSLGWNHRSGLVATLVGALAIAVFTASPVSALGFAVITGLPAWWLAYLALLGRPTAEGTMEWYPVGRLLAWVAATAALTIVATGIISSDGDYSTFQAKSRQISEAFVDMFFEAPEQGSQEAREAMIDAFATATPALSAFGFTTFLAFYLWLAAKVVSVSKRLPRPWPPMPELAMPRSALLAPILAFVLVQFNGFIGALGYAIFGAFLMAFTLQGLAAIHERTQGKPGRGFILAGLYVLLFLTQGIMIAALSLFGLADTIFGLRRRFGGNRPNQPPTPST